MLIIWTSVSSFWYRATIMWCWLCVYMFMCLCAYVCVPAHVPRGTEARGQHQVPPSVVLLQSLGQVLSLKLELRDWQHWPASQPQGCFCLPLQHSLPNTSFYLRAAHQVQVHMLGQQGLYWLRHLLSPLYVVFMWGNIHDLCPCLCNLPQIFSYFKKLENYEYTNISTMRFWGK